MKKNNRGISTVELIVVIAILAIVATGSISLLGSLKNARAKKQQMTIKAKIQTLRSDTMAKSKDLAAKIYYDNSNGHYYMVQGTCTSNDVNDFVPDNNSKIDLTDGITITYDSSSPDVSNQAIDSTHSLLIKFSKSDGGLINSNGDQEGTLTIRINYHGNEKKVVVNRKTGKVDK